MTSEGAGAGVQTIPQTTTAVLSASNASSGLPFFNASNV